MPVGIKQDLVCSCLGQTTKGGTYLLSMSTGRAHLSTMSLKEEYHTQQWVQRNQKGQRQTTSPILCFICIH